MCLPLCTFIKVCLLHVGIVMNVSAKLTKQDEKNINMLKRAHKTVIFIYLSYIMSVFRQLREMSVEKNHF